MGEECKFYYYDSGYSCAVKRKKTDNSSIDSDTVHRYCWGYHYEKCPLYKERHRHFEDLIDDEDSSSEGWCFLTSACVEAKGLSDDCHELTILRHFRDSYLRHTQRGEEEVKEYYFFAPKIVEKIRVRSNSKEIFETIYKELVAPCVELIEREENQQAHERYKNYVQKLREKYIQDYP